jgi:hypothetical protein
MHSKIACDHNDHDHYADDVKDVHYPAPIRISWVFQVPSSVEMGRNFAAQTASPRPISECLASRSLWDLNSNRLYISSQKTFSSSSVIGFASLRDRSSASKERLAWSLVIIAFTSRNAVMYGMRRIEGAYRLAGLVASGRGFWFLHRNPRSRILWTASSRRVVCRLDNGQP